MHRRNRTFAWHLAAYPVSLRLGLPVLPLHHYAHVKKDFCFQLQLCEPGIIIEEVASPGRAYGMGDISFKLHVKTDVLFSAAYHLYARISPLTVLPNRTATYACENRISVFSSAIATHLCCTFSLVTSWQVSGCSRSSQKLTKAIMSLNHCAVKNRVSSFYSSRLPRQLRQERHLFIWNHVLRIRHPTWSTMIQSSLTGSSPCLISFCFSILSKSVLFRLAVNIVSILAVSTAFLIFFQIFILCFSTTY